MQSVRTASSRQWGGASKRKAASNPKPGRRGKKADGLLASLKTKLARGQISGWPFAIVCLLFLLSAAGYGFVRGGHLAAMENNVQSHAHAFLDRAGFTVDEIILQGREHADKKAIVAALGIKQGELIFFFDAQAARARIEKLQWVADARVQRLWPNRLQVIITERRPLALWQRGGSLSLIDSQGAAVFGVDPSAYGNLPLVVGDGAAEVAQDFLLLLAQYPTLEPRVRAVVRVGGRRWSLRLENGVAVELPELEVAEALNDLVKLDGRHRILSRNIEGVDLRLADRVVVRLHAEKKEILNKVDVPADKGTKATEELTEHDT